MTGLAESWLDYWTAATLQLVIQVKIYLHRFTQICKNYFKLYLTNSEYTWCSLSLGANQVHEQILPEHLVFAFGLDSQDFGMKGLKFVDIWCGVKILNVTLPNSPSPMVSSKMRRFLGNSSFWSTCWIILEDEKIGCFSPQIALHVPAGRLYSLN